MANDLIDPKKVRQEMDTMIEMITHPEFVAAMKQMKLATPKQRLELGKELLTVGSLSSKGVKIPEKMRITTRYFEPDNPSVWECTPEGKIILTKTPQFRRGVGSVSWGGCACGGAATVCAGAGGST
jgi:hypothetical protein